MFAAFVSVVACHLASLTVQLFGCLSTFANYFHYLRVLLFVLILLDAVSTRWETYFGSLCSWIASTGFVGA